MTKVSVRHLNEIVRERNQYSRDAMEAWQDFINLKGRMDTELSKVTKRNNYLVEELESMQDQFLKFEVIVEQLNKETDGLKVKIDTYKRENRRLTGLIEHHKDENSRLSSQLTGTEKQRDNALEALVLQQEIAEELERERKRNTKELSALQHTTATVTRQRDEARRVVLHLRSLVSGQNHHLEHLVQGLTRPADLVQEFENAMTEADDEAPTAATAPSGSKVDQGEW
jgi:chromosome segregation ATPase